MKKLLLLTPIVCALVFFSGCNNKTPEKEPTKEEAPQPDKEKESIDLGLSVEWATNNIGAETPRKYGNYYAWGEIQTKETYTEENSKTFKAKKTNIGGDPTYDAALAEWGEGWRLPTKEEFEELISKCKWEWVGDGHSVTGPNGKTLFIPATGFRDGSSVKYNSYGGYYWCSDPVYERPSNIYAYGLSTSSKEFFVNELPRYTGVSVRPVRDKK